LGGVADVSRRFAGVDERLPRATVAGGGGLAFKFGPDDVLRCIDSKNAFESAMFGMSLKSSTKSAFASTDPLLATRGGSPGSLVLGDAIPSEDGGDRLWVISSKSARDDDGKKLDCSAPEFLAASDRSLESSSEASVSLEILLRGDGLALDGAVSTA
jgi:hypothetical protein